MILSPIGPGLREERDLQSQPSAKFAATWDKTAVVAADCLDVDPTGSIWGNSTIDLDFCATVTDSSGNAGAELVLNQVVPLGKIKIPNDKEILITLSAQINLFTLNTATSKKPSDSYYGNIGATSAMAAVAVKVYAVPKGNGDTILCEPGEVTMSSRYVELRNQIGGNVTYDDCVDMDGELDCKTKVADVELESSIGISMDTTAAHSFQWVCPDMPSDVYNIKAMFSLEAGVNNLCGDTSGGDCTTIADLAAARVILGKRIMTIQQARAVQGSLEI